MSGTKLKDSEDKDCQLTSIQIIPEMEDGIVDLVFRRADPTDAAQVSRLIGSTWANFFAYSVTESDLETYLTTTLSEESLRAEIEDPSKHFLVAVRQPQPEDEDAALSTRQTEPIIIGVAQLNFASIKVGLSSTKPAELNRLYINPTQQGAGLAGLLLQSAEGIAMEKGYNGLWLGVWENNARAKRFYIKNGFQERGEHFFWVGKSKRRDLVMEKSLRPMVYLSRPERGGP